MERAIGRFFSLTVAVAAGKDEQLKVNDLCVVPKTRTGKGYDCGSYVDERGCKNVPASPGTES